MALDGTITEHDLDTATQQFVQGFPQDQTDLEPDLAVDGLSESMMSRLIRLITFRRS